jgi:hypothetical protein
MRICETCKEHPARTSRRICNRCARARGEAGLTRPNRPWTTKESKFALENYPQCDLRWLAKKLNRTLTAVRVYCEKNGARRDPDYSNAHRFLPGDKPWNAGITGYRPAGAQKTYFPKGQRPANCRPVGAERVGNGTLYRKIAEGSGKRGWRPVKNIVWESVYGIIPKGYLVLALNGDATDCRIENLICITRAENLKRNSHKTPEARSQAMRKGWVSRRKEKQHDQRPTDAQCN